MERTGCEDYNDLAIRMMNIVNSSTKEYPIVCAYGHYKIIKNLLEVLISSGIPIDSLINLVDCNTDFYDREFVLNLTKDGVSVERIWGKSKYLTSICDVALVHEDCNSNLLNNIKAENMHIEFYMDEDLNECGDCNCKNCGCSSSVNTSEEESYIDYLVSEIERILKYKK